MSISKILSITTFVGLTLACLIIFGWTWEVLSIGIYVSAILSIIYYISLKKVVENTTK